MKSSSATSSQCLAVLVVLGSFGLDGAGAAELCVMCAEPAATYRCALEGDDPARPAAPGMQLLCIKELARRGGHTSCSIDRTHATETCGGVLSVLARPAADPLTPAAPADPAAQRAGPSNAVTPAPAPPDGPPSNAPPATVEAMAKETAEQAKKDWDKTKTAVKEGAATAGEGVKDAGNKVGSALKKSWDCLSSLFSSC